jgi:hypothetical protein
MSVTSFFSDGGVAVGALGHRRPWSPVMKMSGVRSIPVPLRSRGAGAALAVGVFALAFRKTQDQAHSAVCLKEGKAALYRVAGKSGLVVRGMVRPFPVAHGSQ